MLTVGNYQLKYCFCNRTLPLAVYREVAAHLRQVEGVQVRLLPQTSQTFDYLDSQVGGLWLEYPVESPPSQQDQQRRQRVDQILTYYGDRFGAWEVQHPETISPTM